MIRPVAGARRPIDLILSPFQRFFATEAAGGIVLMACAATAMVAANLQGEAWHHLWEVELGFSLGALRVAHPAHLWINDGLMAIFFFVVGLEIRREVLVGELSRRDRATLPIVAALGGMVVPALIYLALNVGSGAQHGWAIPMATDIAFALGVLALAGSRAPIGLTVFVSALAIADDIGAVLVIALFYTDTVIWSAVALAGALLAMGLAAGRAGVREPLVYGLLGVAIWMAVFASGLHATLAGVAASVMIPTRTRINAQEFLSRARALLGRFEAASQVGSALSNSRQRAALENLEVDVERAQSPLTRLEGFLHPWVAFAIVPLFAVANAGVNLRSGALEISSVGLGVGLGLALGKPLGVVGFSLAAVRLGIAGLPAGVTVRHLVGAGLLAGIGFTMSLFIAALAFEEPFLTQAKLGILVGSTVAGALGLLVLRGAAPTEPERPEWEGGDA